MAWGDADEVVTDSGVWEDATVKPTGYDKAKAAIAAIAPPSSGQQLDVVSGRAEGEPLTTRNVAKFAATNAPFVGPLGRTLGAVGSGAVSGGVGRAFDWDKSKSAFENLKNIGTGALEGAVAGKVLKHVFGGAERRANISAVRLAEASPTDLALMREQYGSWEAAGKKMRDLGLAKPGMTMEQRSELAHQLGETAGAKIDSILDAAKRQGATVDTPKVMKEIQSAIQETLYQPGTGTTGTILGARKEAGKYFTRAATDPKLISGDIKAAEAQKRETGLEGYLGPARRFPMNQEAGRADPANRVFKRAYGSWKQGVEDAIENAAPEMLPHFKAQKDISGVTQTTEPLFARAASRDMAASSHPEVLGLGPKHLAARATFNPFMEWARPHWISGNAKIAESAASPSIDAVKAAIIRLLAGGQ